MDESTKRLCIIFACDACKVRCELWAWALLSPRRLVHFNVVGAPVNGRWGRDNHKPRNTVGLLCFCHEGRIYCDFHGCLKKGCCVAVIVVTPCFLPPLRARDFSFIWSGEHKHVTPRGMIIEMRKQLVPIRILEEITSFHPFVVVRPRK